MRRSLLILPLVVAAATPQFIASSPASATKVKKFANCKALNAKYHHGVGRPGARDHVSGRTAPVRNFTVNRTLYNANKGLDRDHDGIACEKR